MPQRSFRRPENIHHHTLLWLVVAQFAAVFVNAAIIPGWLTVFVSFLVVLRYFIAQGKVSELNRWTRLALMLLVITVFIVTSEKQFTVEIAVSFFVLTFSLKTLELKRTRDAYIFGFLTIFLLTLSLLFSQSLFVSLYVFLVLGLCFFALMSINTQVSPAVLRGSLTRVYGTLILAVPLLIVFYLVFPRFGPLWSMPLKSTSAFTGLSETVSPGDVANLAQSAKRAFRAAFNGSPPPQYELYWRALILDRYNGTAWTRSFYQVARDESERTLSGTGSQWDYEITLDPHNRVWAFALENAVVVDGDVYRTPDDLVRFAIALKSPAEYRLATRQPNKAVLSLRQRNHYLRLPKNINPKANLWADELSHRYPDAEDRIAALLTYFNEQAYYYTLKPPLLLTGDRVDEFLFTSRRGFCEHYASSMTYMLRKMNIPARVVVGYLGGEWNRQGEFFVVHQYDAHAWLEAWIEGRGWVRYDPTGAVAPSRVESGIREAMADEDSFLEDSPLALARFAHVDLVNWLRDQLEVINYKWIKLVVNYDHERQQSMFKNWLGRDSLWQLAYITIFLTVMFFIAMGLMALLPEWQRRRKQPLHYIHASLLKKLMKVYPNVHSGMTPRQLLAVADTSSHSWQALKHIVVLMEHCLYSGRSVRDRDIQLLRAQVRRFRAA